MTNPTGISFETAATPRGMRLYAIGDVHGRLDCLARMHALIAAEIERDKPADWRVIHLGDYVDRGPQSRQVLELLIEAQARDPRFLALMGNHDEGFVDFLADPLAGDLFIRYGGFETSASYGVVLDVHDGDALRNSHRLLRGAVPDAHLAFMRGLPRSLSFGDFFFCHAGVRPGIALDSQDPYDLIWIRRAFLDHGQLFDKVVVHGHTPHREPEIRPNRINVDTAAYDTGRLTALVADGSDKRFLVAEA